jgi:hypothetical protein
LFRLYNQDLAAVVEEKASLPLEQQQEEAHFKHS